MVLRPARVDRDHRRQPPRLPPLDPLRGERSRQELRSERGRRQRPPHAGSLEPRRDRDSAARGRAVRRRGAATNRSRRCRRPIARSRRDDRCRRSARPAADGHASPTSASSLGRARIDGPLLVVLDQFEEYFLYHRGDGGAGLARRGALGRAASAAARRPTSCSRFARTRSRSSTASRAASPASSTNSSGSTTSTARPRARRSNGRSSTGTALRARRAGASRSSRRSSRPSSTRSRPASCTSRGRARRGAGRRTAASRIEAPYLQLVLSRLWDEERPLGSRVLRLADARAPRRRRADRAHAPRRDDERARRGSTRMSPPRAFRFLVTPSGTKIAQRVDDLAELSDVPRERLEPVLEELSGGVRILRPTARRRVRGLPRRPRGTDPALARGLARAPEAPSRTASAGAVRVRSGRPRSRGGGVPRAVRGRAARRGTTRAPGSWRRGRGPSSAAILRRAFGSPCRGCRAHRRRKR